VYFTFTVLISAHIVGCFWYFIAKQDNFPPESWVVTNGLVDQSKATQYLASIYWTFTTLVTVGYGDIVPIGDGEIAFSIVWMVLGAGIYSFAIGNLSSVLANLDTRESMKLSKLATINEFCKEARLSGSLKEKLRASVEYTSQKNFFSWVDKQKVFSELPPNLKSDVRIHF